MTPPWDLLIRGGTLIDPARSMSARRDVAFTGGKVAAVAETLAGEAAEVIDATGALVAPGLHTPPPGRVVYNLRGLMSKFLALGMSLDEVVASVTSRAAAAIGKSAELGSLAPGMAGDAVVLDLEDGRFSYADSAGNTVEAARRFRTRHVIREGRRLPAAHADYL